MRVPEVGVGGPDLNIKEGMPMVWLLVGLTAGYWGAGASFSLPLLRRRFETPDDREGRGRKRKKKGRRRKGSGREGREGEGVRIKLRVGDRNKNM